MEGAYFPPRPQKKQERRKYLDTCERITLWMHKTMASCLNSCMPHLVMDLNDGMGKQPGMQGGGGEYFEGSRVVELQEDYLMETALPLGISNLTSLPQKIGYY